jgi:flagellar biosynthesis protein FlhG
VSGARHGWIAVVSGKGGVGKTNVVANLAIAAAGLGARPLVVDGDLGLANVDVLLGLAPPRSVGDALAGRCGIEDTLVDAPRGVRLLPAASARPDLATPGHGVLARLLALIHEVAAPHDLVLIDAGAGVGPAVTGLAAACDRVLAVTTPEPTSLADAYATFKVLRQNPLAPPVELIVNAASSAREARRTHDCLDVLARRFLGEGVRYRGWLPADPLLREAVARQRAAVEAFPTSRWARAVTALAESILSDPQVGALAAADRISPRESGDPGIGVPAAGRR